MEVSGTRKAFEAMLEERGVFHKLGVDKSTVSNWKIYLKQGKSISLDKMEEMLFRYGAQIETEVVWKLPKPSSAVFDNERDFNLALRYMRPGKSISVDFEEVKNTIKVENWVKKFAQDFNWKVYEDRTAWPVVTYSYEEKEVKPI